MAITVRTIPASQHLDFLTTLRSASFLQTPAWAKVKSEWRNESLGWFDGDTLVGVALVLYRQIPKVKRFLAYVPEGPVLDWEKADLAAYLPPFVSHVKHQGAFGVRMGPPVIVRRWGTRAIKDALADESVTSLRQVEPDETNIAAARVYNDLRSLGWHPPKSGEGFAAGQPEYNFQLPLAGRTPDDVLKGMNQLWRRNIKKADKAGVTVRRGTIDDLPAFHGLYAETAKRDGFTPRPLAYFRTMMEAMQSEDPDRIHLYLAEHEGDLVASTTWVRVGTHTWYSYGASSTDKREVRGSNAIQWRMIQDAIAAGADVYDLRGITDSVDKKDPHVGLIEFKVGTGGEAVEYLGEWDLPINRVLYTAFDLYMKRRG
ncbi:Lipid II:glycine glycyltransferase (Peptidoglycan interpeptide bridge formation enzyme) [Raineyella antarctica]|uniref:Lipid II:glycine glycyltransferase (Peptidoglycan interpeptide bridge formation enzyme) n=1 Tax=Raineyella antarctica TaxID=1577474 RepID=A0A1G6HDP5_9ACTN|nr:peptidoglycan bridge formation glycyltransferase FemA/FemB family protein [Raineyella antarctica]SDB92331.1 Lipid II:glycine glycyltransferase (Peptidoglycan interpeptide bridge formation enzyme) [Raineyella antarctica]